MDWIRRNWPDLLIGIALVAVIAGIIATLLTGGSFFPLGGTQASPGRSQPSTSSTQGGTQSGGVDLPSVAPSNDAGETGGPRTGTAPTDSPAETTGGAGNGPTVTALPLPGTVDANNPPATQDSQQAQTEPADTGSSAATSAGAGSSSQTGTPVVTNDSTAAPAATQTSTSSTVSSSVASDGASAIPDGSYRVSVGAFSTAENAERQADTFRSAGFPVFIGTQGNLSIVLVGPYEELAEAERVAQRIRGGNFGIEPVIYRFQEDTPPATGQASTPTQSAPASSPSTSQVSAVAPTPQPTAAAATAGRYLQVGAYANSQSAAPLRSRLEGLGFRVTERVEGTLVKLLVGPFEGNDLTTARARLTEQGIEHFPR